MAGHSKWKNIKHKKAAVDAKKAKNFTRILKDITVSAKAGGGDTSTNSHLRLLIQKAHEMNMPKDNYLRAIKRGTGEIKENAFESGIYEGYGPHNISIIVEILTDNKNRAINELREAFNHNNGRIAENGCVSWMFEKGSLIDGLKENLDENDLLEVLIDFKISNIEIEGDNFFIVAEQSDLIKIKSILIDNKYIIDEASIGYFTKEKITLNEEQEEEVYEFLSNINSLDDVQNIYTNTEIII